MKSVTLRNVKNQQGLRNLASTGASGAAEMPSSGTASRNSPWCNNLLNSVADDSRYITWGKTTWIVVRDQTHLAGIPLQQPIQNSSADKQRKSSSEQLGPGCRTREVSSLSHYLEHGLCSKAWRSVCPQGCFHLHLVSMCKPSFYREVSKPDLDIKPVMIHTPSFHQVTSALPTKCLF